MASFPLSTPIDDIIVERINFLNEHIRPENKPEVNRMFKLQIDMLKSTDLQKLDALVAWKQKEVKHCIELHESERLFTELDALEWLQRQMKRYRNAA